jgi:hypothetical protein
MDLAQVSRWCHLAGKTGTLFCALALLARAGQAEVYRVTRRDGGYEIRFALGTAHGLGPGARVRILNDPGQAVGLAQVEEATPTDSLALVTADQEIKAGYLVVIR